MTIREYAKSVNFEIVGKLHRKENIDNRTKVYVDDARNEYIIDILNKKTGRTLLMIITNEGAVI